MSFTLTHPACTCVCLFGGDHESPPEWEQNPICPVHPGDPELVMKLAQAALVAWQFLPRAQAPIFTDDELAQAYRLAQEFSA